MGSFLVFYSETEGIILNVIVSLAAIAACCYSFHLMAANVGVKLEKVYKRIIYTFIVQVLAVLAAIILCFFFGVLIDWMNMSMSWFTHSWLILGLYFCPLFFAFAMVPAIYFHLTKDVSNKYFPTNFYFIWIEIMEY